MAERRLPAGLEAQTRLLKGFQQARGLPSALVLVWGLLSSVLSHCSWREVSAWSRLIGLTSKVISSQAWHKGLTSQCRLALQCLTGCPTGSFSEHALRMLLGDAIHVSCRDKRADTWRLRLGLRSGFRDDWLGCA